MFAFLGWDAEIQKIKILYEVKINITILIPQLKYDNRGDVGSSVFRKIYFDLGNR